MLCEGKIHGEESLYTEWVLILVLVEDALWGSKKFSCYLSSIDVLILVLVEDALWEHLKVYIKAESWQVLILVLVEDALWGTSVTIEERTGDES